MQSTTEEQPTTVPETIVHSPTKVGTTIRPGLETVDHGAETPAETESNDIPKVAEDLGRAVPEVVPTTPEQLKTVAPPGREAVAPTA